MSSNDSVCYNNNFYVFELVMPHEANLRNLNILKKLIIQSQSVFSEIIEPQNFKAKIFHKYCLWFLQNMQEIISLEENFEELRKVAKQFLVSNWELVKGTMLSPTVNFKHPNSIMLSYIACIVDEVNPLSQLMPGVCIESNFEQYPPLRFLTTMDVTELSQLFKSCDARIRKVFGAKLELSLASILTIINLNNALEETIQSIHKEIISEKYVSQKSWDAFVEVNLNIHQLLTSLSKSYPFDSDALEAENQFTQIKLSQLQNIYTNKFNLYRLLTTHILSDDQQSLIPVACLLSEDYLKRSKIINPYSETYQEISTNEITRLEKHSEKTLAYQQSVQRVAELTQTHQLNLLSQLQQLCKLLRQEDAHVGRGSQSQVGELAFVAITNFFNFYSNLPESKIKAIPKEIKDAIDKLQQVSGEFRGSMVDLIDTCVGSRREQIEQAMLDKDHILSQISLDGQLVEDEIIQAITVRDDLRKDLHKTLNLEILDLAKENFLGDQLGFTKELLEKLKLECLIENYEDLNQFNTFSINEIDVLLKDNDAFQSKIIGLFRRCDDLAGFFHAMRPEQLSRILFYTAANLKQRFVSTFYYFQLLLSLFPEREKRNILIHFFGHLSWIIKAGDLENVKKLLENPDLDVNEVDEKGCTALMLACENEEDEIVELLLNHPKIDITIKNPQGEFALLYACESNSAEIVRILLKKSLVMINEVNAAGNSPLMYACHNDRKEIVEVLLEHPNININIQEKTEHFTALLYACDKNSSQIVDLLLLNPNIDVNLSNEDGTTPLHIACESENEDIVNALLAHPRIQINKSKHNGTTSLHIASKNQNTYIVKDLLACLGINVNAQEEGGITPLMVCAKFGYTEIMELLILNRELDINQVNENQETALMIACKANEFDSIHLILNHPNINVNLFDSSGDSPLILACRQNKLNIVQLLLKQDGIDVNQQNTSFENAFMIACENEHEAIVEVLLAHPNINLNIADEAGMTGLMIAVQLRYYSLVRMILPKMNPEDLQRSNEDGQTAYDLALEIEDQQMLSILSEFMQDDEPCNKRVRVV